MAIDLASLWDYGKPDESERRFRQALEHATGDDALILRTQIARAHGLRKDFEGARAILGEIGPLVPLAGPEVKVRYELELGRTYASATHPPEAQTPENKALARRAFEAALNAARAANMDGLAIDAIHMLAFVDTAPVDQLKWAQTALAVVASSEQPAARRWEASIRNNLGYALHQLGRYEEALEQFELALIIRERGSNPEATRVARWMIAWTLRSLNRIDDALAIQLRLESENDASGTPDPYVFEELAALYAAKGDPIRAQRYAELRKAKTGP